MAYIHNENHEKKMAYKYDFRQFRVITPLQLETRFWGQNYLDLV